MECLRAMFDRQWRRMEVRGEAVQTYVNDIDG